MVYRTEIQARGSALPQTQTARRGFWSWSLQNSARRAVLQLGKLDRVSSLLLQTVLLLGIFIPLVAAATEKPVITIERGHCEGCLEYDLRLFEDGRIEYFGKRNVDLIGERIIQIDPKQILGIVLDLQNLQFFSLSDKRNADTNTIFFDFDCTEWMDPLLAGLKTADECQQGKRRRTGIHFEHRAAIGDIVTLRDGSQYKTLVVDNVNLGEAENLTELIERLIGIVPIRQWTGEEHRRPPLRFREDPKRKGQTGRNTKR